MPLPHIDFHVFRGKRLLPDATKKALSLSPSLTRTSFLSLIMTVEDIMNRDVVTVGPDAALMEVRSRLHEGGFRHLLVVEDDELFGVISDRAVLKAIGSLFGTYSEEPRDVQTLSQSAREIMRTDPVTGHPGTGIEEAAYLLLDHDVSSLPVVEETELVGIVTTEDLLRHYANGG